MWRNGYGISVAVARAAFRCTHLPLAHERSREGLLSPMTIVVAARVRVYERTEVATILEATAEK